jgi:hypothetical protein
MFGQLEKRLGVILDSFHLRRARIVFGVISLSLGLLNDLQRLKGEEKPQ